MGAIGVNGAADDVHDPRERIRVASRGWARWAPVNAVSIGAHLIGAVGMLSANRERVRHQPGVGTSSVAKTVLTAAALGATAYAGILGRQAAEGEGEPALGGVAPAVATSDDVAAAQNRLRLVQWVIPALTGALTVISAWQGEQQKSGNAVSSFITGS